MPSFKFPFKDKAGKEVRDAALYYTALSLADNGFYPLGPSGVHCGIHYVQAMANTLSLDEGMGAIAKGEVVAYQVNRDYPTVPGIATVPMSNGSVQAPFSSGFVLTRHTLEYPAGNKLTYFCLAMHLRSFSDYERLGAKVKRPDYWPATVYRVAQKADHKQASPKQAAASGATAQAVLGLRICSLPNPKGTILGILPRGARFTAVERSADKNWVRIRSLIEGTIAPPTTGQIEPLGGAERGWVPLSHLEPQGKAPEIFDSVVTPKSAIAIKAGALLGHLGEYRRIKDPGQDRVILHQEIIAGPELSGFLAKSRAAAASAKLPEKTLLRVAPKAPLCNPVLAEAKAGLLAANTLVELDGTPHEDALYVKVRPVQTLQWIERKAALPKGAKEASLFRYGNGVPYAARDIVRPPKQGTVGKPGATLYRGILVAAAAGAPVWITRAAYDAIPTLGKGDRGKLLVADLEQGWPVFPLTFVANGPINGPYPQRFDIATLTQSRPAAPDPTKLPTTFALDETGKRWWQVQISDDTTTAIGWAGEVGHTGITLHSPHEWVDFKLIESKPTGEGYGNIFTTAAQMAAFQGGELALTDAQLDGSMREVFASLDTIPDHRLTLGELRAAQRSRGKLGELSRLIIRYPSEWKADPASWDAWDKNVPRSARPAWQSEKARIAKLVWWDAVAGRVEGFPVDPFVFHIHPVAVVGNFMRFSATRLSEKGMWFIYKQESTPGTSEKLHWPGWASGVTLGPGYDMKERSTSSIKRDMVAIGIKESTAIAISAASGLGGSEALKFAKDNSALIILTEAQEFALLRHVVPGYENMVKTAIHVDLDQNEFDAITSYAYNPGDSWAKVVSFINDGKIEEAMAIIRKNIYSGGKIATGLVKRREDETKLFLHGVYEYHGAPIS